MSNQHRIDDLILLAEKAMGYRLYSAEDDWWSEGLYTIISDAIVLPVSPGTTKIWNPFTHPVDALDLQSRLEISLTTIGHPVKRWQASSNEDDPHSIYVAAIVEGAGTEVICLAISECALEIVRAREAEVDGGRK